MSQQWGHRWRSSTVFIATAVIGALFLNTFLYSFVVPILSQMLEDRLHVNPTRTQSLISALLAIHGLVAMLSGPLIGHFADKSSRKKAWIVSSVVGYIPGSLLIAFTPNLWAVYAGRVIQAVAGSGVWVLGFSILTEITNENHLGRILGLTMSFVTAGVIAGPMAGGFLLRLLGYWPAWGICLGLIAIDLIAVALVIRPEQTHVADESAPLIPATPTKEYGSKDWSFYRVMLTDPRALVSLASSFAWSIFLSSFDTTLPLHVRDTFSWDSMLTGAMFAGLQLPALLLNPLAGWLRDRVGLRWPTTVGFALLAPALLFLGTPGQFGWAEPYRVGVAVYVTCVICIGALSSLVVSVAPLGLSKVLSEYERENPYIFGSRGGSSRVFATAEIAWTGGLVVGPLLTGGLNQAVGYFWMNFALAAISLVLALSSSLALRV